MFRLRTDRLVMWSRPMMALLWGLLVSAINPMAATADDPARSPSRFVPARGLTYYLEYEGLGTHAEAWRATTAFEILHRIPAGPLITDVAQHILTISSKAAPGNPMTGAEIVALGEFVVQHGISLACYDDGGDTCTVIVINGLGDKESRDRFERWVRFQLSNGEPIRLPTPSRSRGRNLYRIGDQGVDGGERGNKVPEPDGLTPWTWWFEKDDLIWVVGPVEDSADAVLNPGGRKNKIAETHRARVAAVLDTIDGKQPNASTHPAHIEALAEGRDLVGFEPNGLFFVESRNRLGKGVLSDLRDNLESRMGMPKGGNNEFDLFEAMDISRARQIIGRWGFRGKSLLTDIRFEAPAPWGGLLGLLHPAGFRKDRIPPIPRGMGAFAVGAFARGDLHAANASLGAKVNARYREAFTAFEEAIRNGTSQRLRDDLIRHLGPTACLFAAPGESKETADSTVASVLIATDDADAVAKALDALASQINTYYRGLQGNQGQASGRPGIVLERLPAPDRGYRLTSPAGLIPWLTGDLEPTILVGKSCVAVANNLALAHAAIIAESRPEDRWAPTGELVKMFDSLPANLVFLSVGNPRDSFWPRAIASLPEMVAPLLGKLEGITPDGAKAPGRTFKVPKADELRTLLFPSVMAAVLDDRSFRVISLEALPIGCLRTESSQNFFLPGSMTIEFKFAPRR